MGFLTKGYRKNTGTNLKDFLYNLSSPHFIKINQSYKNKNKKRYFDLTYTEIFNCAITCNQTEDVNMNTY